MQTGKRSIVAIVNKQSPSLQDVRQDLQALVQGLHNIRPVQLFVDIR
jgi:hypothetical protein